MVEAKGQTITDKMMVTLIEEIENKTKLNHHLVENMTEEYEELRIKVNSKMIVVERELADVAKIFLNFKKKHEAGGRKVYTKTLDYYFNALKFDGKKVMIGLDVEIELLKSEMGKINQLRLAQIKNVQECL